VYTKAIVRVYKFIISEVCWSASRDVRPRRKLDFIKFIDMGTHNIEFKVLSHEAKCDCNGLPGWYID
jgi:hypothetical protein